MTKFGLEIPNAVIIGDNHKTGQLFYAGRSQGGRFIAGNDTVLRAMAKAKQTQLKTDLGAEFGRLYADTAQWELRIWD